MYFTIVFMKGYDPAVFHMIITHFERGPFWGLNARTPLSVRRHQHFFYLIHKVNCGMVPAHGVVLTFVLAI